MPFQMSWTINLSGTQARSTLLVSLGPLLLSSARHSLPQPPLALCLGCILIQLPLHSWVKCFMTVFLMGRPRGGGDATWTSWGS